MKFLAITKKELRTFLNTPTFYIISAVFFLVTFLILFFVFQFLSYGSGDATQLFNSIAITLTFILPAITMSSFSKEKDIGTYEYLLTTPLKVIDIIFGKFLAYLIFVGLLLLLTLPFVISVGLITPLDAGQVFAQYIGIFFYASAILSLGIWISTYFNSEIPAFLLTLFLSLILIVGGTDLLNIIPLSLRDTFQTFSVLFHYQSLSNGVFDIKDISFFLGFIGIFLALSHWAIKSEILTKSSKSFKNLYINLFLTLFLSLTLIFLFQNTYFKIDLTSDKRYSLSEASKNIIGSISEQAVIKFYTSSNLPGELQSTQKNVEDLLTEYSRFLPQKIDYQRINTTASEENKAAAQNDGLQEILFQVSSEESSQSIVGYFGVVISYNNQKEVVDITSGIEDLEYKVTTGIRKIANLPKTKIGILNEGTKQTLNGTLITLNEEVGSLFDFVEISTEGGNLVIPEDISVILIPSVNTNLGETVISQIRDFFANGGSIFLMQDTLEPNQTEEIGGVETEFTLSELFSEYGVTVESNIVYDIVQNNVVGISNGLFQVPVDYPFWILASSSDPENQITKGALALPILWSNSLTLGQSAGVTVTPLYETSESSNTEDKDTLNVSLQRNYNVRNDDRKISVAASIEKDNSRAIVVADSDIFSDQILGSLSERDSQDQLVITFVINSLEWLSNEQSISELRGKIRQVIRFTPDSGQITTLLVSSVGLPVAIIIAFSITRQYLRKRNKLNYSFESEFNNEK